RQLAQKLDERFRVLTGGNRTALPRQQTLRALIDWSHDLLSEPEQLLFRRLAIFVGGWTLEAAEAVCTDETIDALDAADLLSSLVEKSLVVAEIERFTRYAFLESMRAFSLEKLEQSGEREAVARRHAQWVAELGDRADEGRWTTSPSQHRAEFDPELENARSALDWALSQDEVVLAARIVVGFWGSYQRRVGQAEVRSRLEAVLERLDADAQPSLAARAWRALSVLVVGPHAVETARHALELGERCNDPAITAASLEQMGYALLLAGSAQEAQSAIDRALRLSKEHGLTRSFLYVDVLRDAAAVASECGCLEDARQLYDEALALAIALGDESRATKISLGMAEFEFQTGNPARALELVSATETEAHESLENQNVTLAATALGNSAAYRIALGDTAGARNAARDAIRIARGRYALETTISMQHLATVETLNGDSHRAGRIRGYVDAWFRNEGYVREPTERRTYEILMNALHEKLSDAQIEALAAEGAQLSEEQAVAEALAVQ
ncbi:MAG: hypothetical protein JO104_07885, partial [Candidatus Eremiobacteraeota bacterium]|nr:hypothetical protein [Candidatus Eremiobacteraeota bacterium]